MCQGCVSDGDNDDEDNRVSDGYNDNADGLIDGDNEGADGVSDGTLWFLKEEESHGLGHSRAYSTQHGGRTVTPLKLLHCTASLH